MLNQKKFLNLFFFSSLFFLLSQFLGIFISFKLFRNFKNLGVFPLEISISQFIFYFFLITFFYLIFFKKNKRERKGSFFHKIFFFLALFIGNLVFFLSLLNFSPLSFLFSFIILFLLKKFPQILTHDLIFLFSLVGGGAILGISLAPQTVIISLLIFSFYDFISVYLTKHMVKLAKEMIKEKTILGFILPLEGKNFFSPLSSLSLKRKNFFILGGGDLIFPLLLSSSLIPFSFKIALFLPFFSFLGFLTSLFLFFLLKRKPFPALPPIAIFSIFGYFLLNLFF